LPVEVRTKADRDCASVAAASVLAKVARDRLMVEQSDQHPAYGFDGHKGYASEKHIAAIREFGPSAIHRKTWLTKILAQE
jgi:ribonuclease HII